MRVGFSLVERVILRREVFARERERERERLARIEKARTYGEVRIGSNIVARNFDAKSQESNLYNSPLSTHLAAHFSNVLSLNFSFAASLHSD